MNERSPGRGPVGRKTRLAVAALLAVVVTAVTVAARTPAGAGIYYDDGVYLALGRALAEGQGYVYSNLPGEVPGVKYPPLYPLVLSAAWRVFPTYPANLPVLKSLNALLMGLAAGATFLLFAHGRAPRVAAAAAITAFGYLAVTTLTVSTALLSEPLFLLLACLALLAAGGQYRRVGWAGLGMGALAAAAVLTRSVGLALVAAILVAWLQEGKRRAVVAFAAAALIPCVAWLAWSAARASEVPALIWGQYGGYLTWLAGDPGGRGAVRTLLEGLGTTLPANLAVLWETLTLVWIPRAPRVAELLVVFLGGVAVLYGMLSIARRNLSLALFPPAYVVLVLIWPYEAYRFLYAILPLLTLLAAEGGIEAARRLRGDAPRWSPAVAGVALALLAFNAIVYQAQGHARRAWSLAQTYPASAYAPLTEWLTANTRSGEVIGSALDPYIHWQTGRRAVPSWRFRPEEHGWFDTTRVTLSADLDSLITLYRPAYVGLVTWENKAAATLRAFADRHPEQAVKAFESAVGPYAAVAYRVTPAGERADPGPAPPAGESSPDLNPPSRP